MIRSKKVSGLPGSRFKIKNDNIKCSNFFWSLVEKTLEKKKKEKSTENKVPSKKKSATPSAPKKLSEETAAAKKACNSIENQENRVNCANSKNYKSESTSNLVETESKEPEHCQNGTNQSRIIAVQLNDDA